MGVVRGSQVGQTERVEDVASRRVGETGKAKEIINLGFRPALMITPCTHAVSEMRAMSIACPPTMAVGCCDRACPCPPSSPPSPYPAIAAYQKRTPPRYDVSQPCFGGGGTS